MTTYQQACGQHLNKARTDCGKVSGMAQSYIASSSSIPPCSERVGIANQIKEKSSAEVNQYFTRFHEAQVLTAGDIRQAITTAAGASACGNASNSTSLLTAGLAGGAGLLAGGLAGATLFGGSKKDKKKAEEATAKANEAEERARKAEEDAKKAREERDRDVAAERQKRLDALKTVTPGSGTQLPDDASFRAYFDFGNDTQKRQSFLISLEQLKGQLGTGTFDTDVQASFQALSPETQKKIRDAVGVADGAAISATQIVQGMQAVVRSNPAEASEIMARIGGRARAGNTAEARRATCGETNGQPIDCISPAQRFSNFVFAQYDLAYQHTTGRSPTDRETCIALPDSSGQRTCSTKS